MTTLALLRVRRLRGILGRGWEMPKQKQKCSSEEAPRDSLTLPEQKCA